MTNLETLQVTIKAKTKKFRDEMDRMQQKVNDTKTKVKNHTDKINKSVTGMGSTIKKVVAAVSFAAIIAALIRLGKSAVDLASQLVEVQNVVDTAFKDMSYKIENFAKTAMTYFGLSELSAKRYASAYMDMSINMGIGAEKASNMAIAMTAMVGDFASYRNISNEMANTALSAVWTGETETLKRYGIVMTENNLSAFALSNGITKTYNAMSQAEKTTLRYNFIMNQLTTTQGDFVRTGSGWANTVRVITERFKQLFTIIGNGIMKVLLPLIQVFNMILAQAVTVVSALSKIFGFDIDSGKNAEKSIGSVTSALSGVENQAVATKKALGAIGIDELNILNDTSSSTGSTGAGVGDGFDIDYGSYDINAMIAEPDTSKIQTAIIKINTMISKLDFTNMFKSFDKVKTSYNKLVKTVSPAGDWLFKKILKPLAKWTISRALPAFFDTLSGVLEVLTSVLETLKPLFSWLWDEILEPIASWTGGIAIFVIEGIATALSGISDWISNHKSLVEGVLITITSLIAANKLVFGGLNAISGISKLLTAIIGGAGGLSAAFAFLTTPVGMVAIGIGLLIAVIVLLIKNWDTVKAVAINCWNSIKTAWNNAGEWINNHVFKPIGTFFDNLVTGISNTWDRLTGFFKDGINSIIGWIEDGVNFGISALNKLVQGINEVLSIDVPDWIPEIGGNHFGVDIKTIGKISIPRLANGGLAFGPTTAIVGDNPNAANDPEVIAPFSKIESMLGDGNRDLLLTMISILERILDKDLSVTLDNRELAKGYKRGNRKLGYDLGYQG